MAPGSRIPIPWNHRLRRFRYSALPVVSFFGCVLLTVWLWRQQAQMPNAVGEVERQRVAVTARADGILLRVNPPEGGEWDLLKIELAEWEENGEDWKQFDSVHKGQIIARLDHRDAAADLKIVQLAIDGLREDVAKTEEEIRLGQADRLMTGARLQADQANQRLRLITAVVGHQVDVINRDVAIAVSWLTWQRLDHRLQLIDEAHSNGHISDAEYFEVKDEWIAIAAGIKENEAALVKVRKLLKQAEDERDTFQTQHPELPHADEEALLAPLLTEIRGQEALLDKVRQQIESLVIRAPIDGTICEIFCQPGEYVQAATPILTIASHHGRYVQCYVPEDLNFRPQEQMEVDLKLRIPGSRPVLAEVAEVGPQFEEIPLHHRRDPARIEWGLPCLIWLPNPSDFPVRPGEKVDVRFKPWTVKVAG